MAEGGPKNIGSYYRRPSKAIERGGGFYVPGLEGYRLRVAVSALLLALIGLNRLPGYEVGGSQLTSEALGVAAALALLAQAVLDRQKEVAVQRRREALAAASEAAAAEGQAVSGEVSFVKPDLGIAAERRLRWVADVLLQLTPASVVVFFDKDGVLARIGVSGGESDEQSLLALALSRAAAAHTDEEEEGAGEGGKGVGSLEAGARRSAGPPAPIAVMKGDEGATPADDAVMRLLPGSCQQGLLRLVRAGAGGAGLGLLLGCPLRGTGAFPARDLDWLSRLCGYLELAGGVYR